MNPEFLDRKETEQVLEKLEIYGIEEIPFLLVKSGSNKIRACTFKDREQISRITNEVFTELIGLYFAKIDGEEIRLSIDALHLLKNQLKHNILEIDDKQKEEYLSGNEPQITEQQAQATNQKIYYILKHNQDILGMAKIVQGVIKNYLPKERRRKN